MKNAVVLTDAPRVNYMHNFVCLPYYYGTEKYFARPDVGAIRETVYQNLTALGAATGFREKFRGRRVLIKPNLVIVMHKCGYALDDIPQSTDPRVFDAVMSYLADLGCALTIVESAGKGTSTMEYFRIAGYDKIARQYGAGLVALEEQPVDHYYAPLAQVQKDVWLPRVMGEAVRGEALYVSVPKLKTNLYTEVTLGLKNAMGVLPGNMRYRNHTWQIGKKLTDLLYLLNPDLTVVDGIVGGEGGTPAPVDPVKVGMILSGTNGVEVDRVAARVMGFDPDTVPLIREAAEEGFGDSEAEVIGSLRVVPFRRAEASFLTPRFQKNWPNVRYFVGHTNSRAPAVTDLAAVTPALVYEMEGACRGGCLATMCSFMEMVSKGKHPNRGVTFGVVLGNGCEADGRRYWFDAAGRAYDLEALKSLGIKTMLGVGACTKEAYPACTLTGGGCSCVGDIMGMFMKGTHMALPMLSPEDDALMRLLRGSLTKYWRVRRLIKSGERVDIPFDAIDDRVTPIPELLPEDREKAWIFVPSSRLGEAEIKESLRDNKPVTFG